MSKQFNPKTGSRGIDWTDRTIPVFGGCMHGCRWRMPDGTIAKCYAEEIAESVASPAYPEGFAHHYFRPGGMAALAAGKVPELRFVDSMADMFAKNVPEEQIRLAFDAMRAAPQHSFQSLTKNPPRLLKFTGNMPPNLWVGASSPPDFMFGKELSRSQQRSLLMKSLEVLTKVKERTGNLVWLSAEPLSWDITEVLRLEVNHPLDWIVIGAASSGNRYFQPQREHVRSLLNTMDATDTPAFFKGNLKPLFEREIPDEYWVNRERLNRWREDFPRRYRDGSPIPAVERRQEMCRKHGWALSA